MRASRFLDRFRTAQRDGTSLLAFADDSDGFLDAVIHEPEALGEAIDEALAAPVAPIAELVPGSFASAACDRDGHIVIADASFSDWLDTWSTADASLAPPSRTSAHLALLVKDDSGRPVAVASGGAAAVKGWPITADVRRALDRGEAEFALLAFRPADAGIGRAARAHRFTPAETRLVSALAETGNLRDAAAALGIGYETARKLVASAMTRAGAARQTELIREVLRIAAGELAPPSGIDRLFGDLFGLTLRQAMIARGIAHGHMRAEVARSLNISDHAVKSDLKAVFVACGVEYAVDLARVVAEVDALAGLAAACDIVLSAGVAEAEPLRLIARAWTSGRIAVADHGPPEGVPVLLVHATSLARAISPRLIAALQARGMRPIAFDRAGFGLSDAVDACPYRALSHDVDELCATLELGPVLLLSRGVPGATVTAAGVLPDRVVGGVLLNPDPPVELDQRRKGMMGAARALFYDRPWLAERMARLLSQRTSEAAIAKLMRQSVAESPIDLGVLDDPAELAALVRGGRQCALGMRGFLADMQAQSEGKRATPLNDGSNWTILVGERDPLYAFDPTERYWRKTLPGVTVERIAEGGRWLHATHSAQVADALLTLARRAGLTPAA